MAINLLVHIRYREHAVKQTLLKAEWQYRPIPFAAFHLTSGKFTCAIISNTSSLFIASSIPSVGTCPSSRLDRRVSASACTAAASARMYATASSYAGMTPGATGGFHSRGLSRLIFGRIGGYFGFLRAGLLRFGGEVEGGSTPRGLVDASEVVDEPVSGGVDVTLERDSSVELARASGTVTARSRHNLNITGHDDE